MKKPLLPYKKGSLLFAPMEGITDPAYRKSVMELYPEWDMFATDFLRVPTEGHLTPNRVIEHMGSEIYEDKNLRDKTTFQILTTPKANTLQALEVISSLEINHLDLNIGCPSRRVNAHLGGSYLLSDLKLLENVVGLIRKNFNKCFTVKIRAGYKDDLLFEDILKTLQDCGVEAITIHGRTRVDMYKGIARWEYFKRATKLINVPVISNGDIWTPEDVEKVFNETNCYAIMCARSAMKTPWLARSYQKYLNDQQEEQKNRLQERIDSLPSYFSTLERNYRQRNLEDPKILKKFKALIRYSYDDFENGETIKRQMLRTTELDQFKSSIY